MAYITFKPSDYFNNFLYSGNSTARTFTDVGFQSDWVWIKDRTNDRDHMLFDSVRTATKDIHSNNTDSETTIADTLTAFTSNGFSLGTDSTASSALVNGGGNNYVAWNWKAGTTSGITTNGSTVITPSAYSFSTTSGFSIVKYTGNGNTTTKVAHGLGAVPKWILIKNLDDSSDNWQVYHVGNGNTTAIQLDNNGGTSGGSDRFYDVTPDTVNFTLGNHVSVNNNGENYIAYCFAEVPGFSKFGKYQGINDADGPFIYTGFRPSWFMIKRVSSGYSWAMKDNKINPRNVVSVEMYANDQSGDTAGSEIDFLSNGVKLRTTSGTYNHSGIDYIYMAFAEHPLVASNGDPGTAR